MQKNGTFSKHMQINVIEIVVRIIIRIAYSFQFFCSLLFYIFFLFLLSKAESISFQMQKVR